jgi:methylmalonyl-CoA mutase C-terminal domain/subunit
VMEEPVSRIRVLLAKPGLDGHFRGVAVVGAALRNAGMEVIYTGPRQTVQTIVNAAVAEDVDIIGLNVMTSSSVHVVKNLFEELDSQGLRRDFVVLVGGIVKPSEAEWLRAEGVDGVFGPGTSTKNIVQFVRAAMSGGTTE